MTWHLTIPVLPLSMNERERTHWAIRSRELAQITTAIHYLAAEQRIPKAKGRRSVLVTIHKSLRSRVTDDPANRDSRAKSILDAMVATGLLVDDDDTHLEWLGVVEGERLRAKQTVVTISEG